MRGIEFSMGLLCHSRGYRDAMQRLFDACTDGAGFFAVATSSGRSNGLLCVNDRQCAFLKQLGKNVALVVRTVTLCRFAGVRLSALVHAAEAAPMCAANAAAGPLPQVLLLHGIWNDRARLGPLAWRLCRAGFRVARFGYSTAFGGAEAALAGHSLGGLIAPHALRREPQLPVTRVVCLGMPLAGSAAAQSLLRRGLGIAPGRSAALLQKDLGHWDGRAAVGMVAASVADAGAAAQSSKIRRLSLLMSGTPHG
ncbi:esterase/lipase family protein [Xanthomonas translucens]|uniref:esterase/lipase family protein n=3 Tax=Xanthomonas campestris pv. translucens TaxID=343 RepID=UPI001E348F47|nr:alpha/beta hydrolase [Xanthomonas translucens]